MGHWRAGLKFDLRTKKELKLTVFIKQRRDQHCIAKGGAIAFVIENFEKDGRITFNGAAYCFTQPWLGGWASQKFAVPPNDSVFGVTRQINKRGIARDDWVIRLTRITYDRRDRTVRDQDIQPRFYLFKNSQILAPLSTTSTQYRLRVYN